MRGRHDNQQSIRYRSHHHAYIHLNAFVAGPSAGTILTMKNLQRVKVIKPLGELFEF